MSIATDIYDKPTLFIQYLLFSQCFAKHISSNIPLKLARKDRTIYPNPKVQNKSELKVVLLERKTLSILMESGIDGTHQNYKH